MVDDCREPLSFHDVQKELEPFGGASKSDTRFVTRFARWDFTSKQPEVERAWEVAKKFWAKRFFTSEYLKFDRPYPGAVEFTKKFMKWAHEVVYLTGRDEPGMGKGTRRPIRFKMGFLGKSRAPICCLKAVDSELRISSTKLSRQSISASMAHWSLPSKMNRPIFRPSMRAFPDAMHVFVDTVSSDHEAIPRQGLYRIEGFWCS